MRFSYSLLLLIVSRALLFPLWLPAQEVKKPVTADLGVINDIDVTKTDVTEERLNNPPKREIKVERLKEPQKLQLPKADPKILEQKFTAAFELRVSRNAQAYRGIFENDVEVQKLAILASQYINAPYEGANSRPVTESLGRMIKALPKDAMVAPAEKEFFIDPEHFEGMITFSFVTDPADIADDHWSFRLLGTSPEEAERRCKALIDIFDQGSCRPVRLAIFKKREPLCVQLREQRKGAEAALQAVTSVQSSLKMYADFTPDMLSNLRVQQLQLEVELAGVKARIATCDRLLAQANLKLERKNQIEDVKVAAEIEFSGFEARLTKSNEFIAKVKQKVELLENLAKVEAEQRKVRSKIRGLEEQIQMIDAAIRAYAPLPLVDNKITIQPLEWTQ